MPIDIKELKRKHGQDAKPQPEKTEQPITKVVEPLIKEKKNDIKIEQETRNEQEIRNKMIKEIIRGNNMTQQKKKKTVKGKSGLERAVNTKEQYDSLFGVKTEAQENIQKEASIGVDQPINNDNEFIEFISKLNTQNQGNNGGLLGDVAKFKLMRDMFAPQQQGGSNSKDIAMMKMLSEQNRMMAQQQMKNMELIIENSNIKFAQFARMMSGNEQEDPRKVMMEGFQLYRDITGDKCEKSKDEMHYDIEKKKLELQEYARRDGLDREERSVIRDDQKSQRFMDIGGVVLDKVIGNGLGALMNDLMNVKNKSGNQKGETSAPVKQDSRNFDVSLLDELND